MKKIIVAVSLFSIFAFNMFSQSADSLLLKAQNNTAFFGTDFCADYTIVQDKPGEGRSVTNAIIYRRDSASKWTILLTGPAKDKGKGYLKFDSNIWFYDPVDKAFTFTSARDKIQGTNVSTSDLAPHNYTSNYKIESSNSVKLGSYDCTVFELSAVSSNVEYPRLKLWVSSDGLIRKRDDFSLSGQRLRTLAIPSYQKVVSGSATYWIPVNMVIQDGLKGKKINGKMEYEKSVISIANPKLEKVSDTVYTKPYLEMNGAK